MLIQLKDVYVHVWLLVHKYELIPPIKNWFESFDCVSPKLNLSVYFELL